MESNDWISLVVWQPTDERSKSAWPMDSLLSNAEGASAMDATQAEAVYGLVVQGFAELGASNPRYISRAFLLKDGHYAGQAFRCDGWRAVWLIDGDAVEFYDATGNLVKTPRLASEVTRKAA
jgi:hypothetical protein